MGEQTGGTRVKPIEHDTIVGHRVQVRRHHEWMTGETRVAVSVIIRHHQDDVWALIVLGHHMKAKEAEKDKDKCSQVQGQSSRKNSGNSGNRDNRPTGRGREIC